LAREHGRTTLPRLKSQTRPERHIRNRPSDELSNVSPEFCPIRNRPSDELSIVSSEFPIMKSVPVTSLKKFMGHAKLETTAIYVDAVGAQQQEIAARMWE
jgi:hypothetical protein